MEGPTESIKWCEAEFRGCERKYSEEIEKVSICAYSVFLLRAKFHNISMIRVCGCAHRKKQWCEAEFRGCEGV